MTEGIKTLIFPVSDVAKAKTTFSRLLGVEPYADQPYYVGFKVNDQDVGLERVQRRAAPGQSAAGRRVSRAVGGGLRAGAAMA